MDAQSNKIKIEKGIPLVPESGRKTFAKYPWHKMEVGDSFLYPPHITDIHAASVSSAYGKKVTGFTFKNRTTTDGIRCWRVA